MNRTILFIFFLLFTSVSTYSQEIEDTLSSKELVIQYEKLSYHYLNTDGKKSIMYANKAIDIAKEEGYYRILCDMYRILGQHSWANYDFDNAEKEFSKGLKAVEQMEKSQKYNQKTIDNSRSSLLGAFGNLYNTKGNGALAIEYYVKAATIFEKYHWYDNLAIAFYNTAELYSEMLNTQRAEYYYLKADSTAKINKNYSVISMSYKGLATIHLNRKEYNEALMYITEVYNYIIANIEVEGAAIVSCRQIMADIYIEMGEQKRGEQIIMENLSYCDSVGIKNTELFAQVAELYLRKSNYERAKEYALESLEIDDVAPITSAKIYKILSKAYSHLGDSREACRYMDKADSIDATISNYAYQASLSEQEARYEAQAKDDRISLLTRERRAYITLLIIILLLLILLVTIIIMREKLNRRSKELINNKIILDTETAERQYISKELHDGLGGLLSLLKLKIQESEIEESLKIADKSISELRRISHHLLPEELLSHGLITALKDFVLSVPGGHFKYYEKKKKKKKKGIATELEQTLYRSAFELVNNALKHSNCSNIYVEVIEDDETLILTVSDDGVGFDPSSEHFGFGLKSINKRISSFGGEMAIISTKGEGTEINITIKQ